MEPGIAALKHVLRETVLMKPSRELEHTGERDEVMRMMRHSIAHEISRREPHKDNLIMQGDLPETKEYSSTYRK
jgi:hypothetical protein